MLAWIPRKLRYLLMVLALLSMAVPTGISHDTVITGHTVFKNAAGYDKCLASIVGLARAQVLWFNDQTLVETDPKGQYVYAVRAGAKAPPPADKGRESEPIFGDGVVYEFIDPNGHRWVVLEGSYVTGTATSTDTDGVVPTPSEVSGSVQVKTEMVWIVQISPTHRDNNPGADLHEFYNFVTIVDTCKFGHGAQSEGTVSHAANDPNHPPGEHDHSHEVYEVDLYIGKDPKFVPLGANATNPAVYSETVGNVKV